MKNILVIEEDLILLGGLKFMLERFSKTYTDLIIHEKIPDGRNTILDLAIIDFGNGSLDAHTEMAVHLRRNLDIPVIILSGDDDQQPLANNAAKSIPDPWDLYELRTLVAQTLSHNYEQRRS